MAILSLTSQNLNQINLRIFLEISKNNEKFYKRVEFSRYKQNINSFFCFCHGIENKKGNCNFISHNWQLFLRIMSYARNSGKYEEKSPNTEKK